MKETTKEFEEGGKYPLDAMIMLKGTVEWFKKLEMGKKEKDLLGNVQNIWKI